MIDYTPFWETLKQSGESWYTLTNKKTLNDSCRLLHCEIQDIFKYIPSATN